MSTANTGYFSALLAPGLRKVFFETSKEFPEEYSQIAEVLTSKRAYEEDIVTTGLGLFQAKAEGQPITYDNGLIGTAKRFTHSGFGLGFRVTREMYDDDQYDVMKKMTKQLAKSARLTVEYAFGNFMDLMFTATTGSLSHDGASVISTSHTALTGGTQANRPATEIDLSITGLRAGLENLENTLSERGLPEPRRGVQLIVDPTFQWIAKELTESQGKPYTSDNEPNAFKDMGLKYMVYHYMTVGNGAWFLMAPKADRDIKFFWRTKTEFNNSDDFDTKDAKFSGFMRYSFGVTDWRGIYGSTGI